MGSWWGYTVAAAPVRSRSGAAAGRRPAAGSPHDTRSVAASRGAGARDCPAPTPRSGITRWRGGLAVRFAASHDDMRPDHAGVLEELGNEEEMNNAGCGEGQSDPGMGTQEDVGDGRADDQLSPPPHRVVDKHRALEESVPAWSSDRRRGRRLSSAWGRQTSAPADRPGTVCRGQPSGDPERSSGRRPGRARAAGSASGQRLLHDDHSWTDTPPSDHAPADP